MMEEKWGHLELVIATMIVGQAFVIPVHTFAQPTVSTHKEKLGPAVIVPRTPTATANTAMVPNALLNVTSQISSETVESARTTPCVLLVFATKTNVP